MATKIRQILYLLTAVVLLASTLACGGKKSVKTLPPPPLPPSGTQPTVSTIIDRNFVDSTVCFRFNAKKEWKKSTKQTCSLLLGTGNLACPVKLNEEFGFEPFCLNQTGTHSYVVASGILHVGYSAWNQFSLWNGDEPRAVITVHPDEKSLMGDIKKMKDKTVEIFLQQKNAPTKSQDQQVTQEGNLSFIGDGEEFMIDKVRIQTNECVARHLRAFLKAQMQLIIRIHS